MKKIALVVILLAASVLASYAQTQQQMLDKISSAAVSLKALDCDFQQTKKVKLLNRQLVSNGHMCYVQADKLRWEYKTPYVYTFILNNNKVKIQKNGRNDIINVDNNKMFREIVNVMLSSVSGTCLKDKSSFKATAKSTTTEYIATLVPQKKNMKQMFSQIVLHYNIKANVVDKIEMIETNGDFTTIVLKNIKKNVAINESQFSVN